MKNLVTLLVAGLLISSSVYSQGLIAVQNGGEPLFYTSLDSAIVNAQNGDTLYISGGFFDSDSLIIDKKLFIFGAGANPDSSSATIYTRVDCSIRIENGGEGGFLTGINLQDGSINLENINTYTLSRCIFWNLEINNSSGISIHENVIQGNVDGGSTENTILSNNIINGYITDFSRNSGFRNNILFVMNQGFCNSGLTQYYYAPVTRIAYSYFENNIFYELGTANNLLCLVSNCIFLNNLFARPEFYFTDGCYQSDNIFGQSSGIFTQNNYHYFSYESDYHLQESSPGKNGGKDGTDIGIYGGIFPWKEGSIPVNPHFQQVQVAPKTDANGNLNVNIKVAAQER